MRTEAEALVAVCGCAVCGCAVDVVVAAYGAAVAVGTILTPPPPPPPPAAAVEEAGALAGTEPGVVAAMLVTGAEDMGVVALP